MGNNHNRIPVNMQVPLIGQQQVMPQHFLAPGPLVQPTMWPGIVEMQGGKGILTFGGLTKLEYAAIHLGDVDRAAEILEECQRRQAGEPEEP